MFSHRADSQEAFAHWELSEGTLFLLSFELHCSVGTAFVFYTVEMIRGIFSNYILHDQF